MNVHTYMYTYFVNISKFLKCTQSIALKLKYKINIF